MCFDVETPASCIPSMLFLTLCPRLVDPCTGCMGMSHRTDNLKLVGCEACPAECSVNATQNIVMTLVLNEALVERWKHTDHFSRWSLGLLLALGCSH